MHKKYSKRSHKDHHNHTSTSRREGHVRTKRETDDSVLDIVPQNSRKEFGRKLEIGDYEKENTKTHRDKHKYKHKDDNKSKEHDGRNKHEKLHNVIDIQGVMVDKESNINKEKKGKLDKERLNKMEKYFEELHKEKKRICRSVSLESSDVVVRHKEKHIRREKTFHDAERDISAISRFKSPQKKEQEPPKTTIKDKSDRKHKRKESRKREASKDTNIRENQDTVMYCQVELQNPFLQGKKNIELEPLYTKNREKFIRKRSSSRDSIIMVQLDAASKSTRDKHKQKAQKNPPIKFSPRKSKIKIDTRHYKDKDSDDSLSVKYFACDRRPQTGKESSHHRKKKHDKPDSLIKLSHEERRSEMKGRDKTEGVKIEQEKNSSHTDHFKAKIEDDIKSYFSKIQTLIDKKLDFILGNSGSKESKNSLTEKETENRRNKKDKKSELSRQRSHSKKRKKSETNKSIEEEKRKEKRHEESLRMKFLEAMKEGGRTRGRTASNITLDMERYPIEDSGKTKRHRSPFKYQDESIEEIKHRHKRSDSEGKEHKMSPDRLINMLEHPSLFSISNTCLAKEKQPLEVKHKPRDSQPGHGGNDYHRKRDKSSVRRHEVPDQEDMQIEELKQAYLQEAIAKKIKHRMKNDGVIFTIQSNPKLAQKIVNDGLKTRPESTNAAVSGGQYQQQHHKRDNSLARRNAIPLDKIDVVEMDQKYLQEKTLKKRLRQLMNLECKTVSIVGIPSQIRESTTIFNETQTTTSLNVFPIEDSVEQKKKSKRFKLYYKYSVADNKCLSEKSSDGMRSAVSDSFRVISDPSDNYNDVWEEKYDESKSENKDGDLRKYAKGKDSKVKRRNNALVERIPKKYRKRAESLKPIALNNILEEPSNISITVHHDETLPLPKKALNCTYFHSLRSSSSDCMLRLRKKSFNGWNYPMYKYKNRNTEKPLEEVCIKPKTCSKRDHVKYENKPKHEERSDYTKKVRKIVSHERIKRQYNEDMVKYRSRSDINVSYDSLKKCRLSKGKQESDTSTLIKEQLKELLPELFIQNPSPVRESLDVILKEELKEIIKEFPIDKFRKNSSTENLKQDLNEPKPKSKDNDKKIKDTQQADSNERATDQCSEDHTFETKKTGTLLETKIPSLIKNNAGIHQAAQVISEELMEAGLSNYSREQDELIGNVLIGPSEKTLVSVATEISIVDKKTEVLKTKEVVVREKRLQTTSYAQQEVERPKQLNNLKRCHILDPATEPKKTYMSKPIINLENCQFPSRKQSDSNTRCNRSNSMHHSRPRCILSERQTEKFESNKVPATNNNVNKRPASAQDKYVGTSKIPVGKIKKRPTLTMSTNIITIQTPIATEVGTDTHDTQTASSRVDLKNTRNSRSVKTCVERTRTQDNLGSISTLSLNPYGSESRIGSLVCVDRFSTQKTNFSSKSNSRSLDRYTAKSIISDNVHASTLFFTKNFSPEMNTYQRRKMYDEVIRKKMKKKHGNQNQMGPRVYEVRYLTLENGNVEEVCGGEKLPMINQTCITKLPTFNTKINKGKQKMKIPLKKSRKNFPKNKEDACKYSGRDIFAPIITDVDQLNKFRRKSFPEKNLKEIYINDNQYSHHEKRPPVVQNSNFPKTKQPLMANVTSNNVDIVNPIDPASQNVKGLIDCLYNSLLTYCNTRFPTSHVEQKLKPSQNFARKTEAQVEEKSYVIFPKTSNDSINTIHNAFRKVSSSEGSIISDEKQRNFSTIPITAHLSCPVLAGPSPSFDYLYEDAPIDLDKEAILMHFRKPIKTILGYALNNIKPMRRDTFRNFRGKEDQILTCEAQSEESGYSSNHSKKCASVCSFFKRPGIANLFKPVRKLEVSSLSTESVKNYRSGPNLQEYHAMNQKCIEYAEKVRNQTQNKKPEQVFEEIPLDVLLLRRKSSALFEDFNSNCSLCKKRPDSCLSKTGKDEDFSTNIEDTENRTNLNHTDDRLHDNLENENLKDVEAETLIYYEDTTHKPSLEIITFQKSQPHLSVDNSSQLITDITGGPVILSITNLNSCSLTLIEESVSNNNIFCTEDIQNKSYESNVEINNLRTLDGSVCSNYDLRSLVHTDIDGRSDISSSFGFNYLNTPSASNKFMAKRFFDNLLKVYEKEMNVTNKLFRDDNFFVHVLLESINSNIPKKRGMKLTKYIKNKIKHCFGNMFSLKHEVNPQAEDNHPIGNHQKRLQVLASNARGYFSMYVEAVRTNKDINDEVKICGLLKLLERIEDGDFALLRKKEEVDFEEEIREQVKEAFVHTYHISFKEAKKQKRSLTKDDLNLIRTFVSKYRIGLLSKTDLIATYIGKGVLKSENHLKAAVTYLIQQNKYKNIDIKDFEAHCKSLKCSE